MQSLGISLICSDSFQKLWPQSFSEVLANELFSSLCLSTTQAAVQGAG